MIDHPEHPESPSRKPHRARRWLLRILIAFILLTLAAELFARYRLGLGDPPLMITDPQIEYLYQPSRTYERFGNHMAFNRWSMRSDDFGKHKADPNELRMLVLGDSVVNGGAQTDQRDIASEIIHAELPRRVGRPVVVGNISAGSWGAPNMLAYANKYGFFDADVVIIVLSSHDWNDVPTFTPLGVDFPERKPALALQEAMTRYLPRYLPGGSATTPAPPAPEPPPDSPDVHTAITAVGELVTLARESGAKVAVAQHLERDETMDRLKPGHDVIMLAARDADADVIQLGPSFAQARQAGMQPYRDDIHPNEMGQRVIAQTLMDWIVAVTRGSAPATAPTAAP
jgi:hypothetical protein